MRKKFLVLFCFISFLGFAQKKDYFSSDTAKYISDLSIYFIDDICLSVDSNYCDQLQSINNIESEAIQIFPNPTSDNIWIKVMQPFNYSLIGNDGKTPDYPIARFKG